nr:ATP synthase F0 subunit 8 [Chelurotropella siamensis]
MPQMMPMWWEILMLMFITMMMLFMMILYHNNLIKMNKIMKCTKFYNQMNWKW